MVVFAMALLSFADLSPRAYGSRSATPAFLFNIQRGNSMRKVIRGYAKDKNPNLILIGTIPVPHSKDKCSPAARQAKRYLVRQGATIFKKRNYTLVALTQPVICAVTASQLVAPLSHGQVEFDFCGSIALGRPERHKSR